MGPGFVDLAVSCGAEGSALATSDDCFGAAGGRGLAELAPVTAALCSNLLSLVVRPAISEALSSPARQFQMKKIVSNQLQELASQQSCLGERNGTAKRLQP